MPGPTEVTLRFYERTLALRSEEPRVVDYCRALFGRFVQKDGSADSTLEILRKAEGWQVRDSVLDVVVAEAAWLPGIATARILETVGNEVDTHDLFHAAAVCRDGRGLILLGESGFGKSVLTLALLDRGWQFLSDEVAALDGREPLLRPFPKAIELRPEGARLVGIPAEAHASGRGKVLHDAEELFPGCLADSARPAAIVFLEDPEIPKAGEPEQVGDLRRLHLVVHRRVDGLPEELQESDGVVRAAWSGEDRGFPALEIDYDPKRFAAWRLDEPLGRRGALLIESSAEARRPVDFEREPRLERLGAPVGIAGLLARFRGRRALARRLQAQAFPELFGSLLDRLQGTRFFRLAVGRLQPSVTLLEQAVR